MRETDPPGHGAPGLDAAAQRRGRHARHGPAPSALLRSALEQRGALPSASERHAVGGLPAAGRPEPAALPGLRRAHRPALGRPQPAGPPKSPPRPPGTLSSRWSWKSCTASWSPSGPCPQRSAAGRRETVVRSARRAGCRTFRCGSGTHLPCHQRHLGEDNTRCQVCRRDSPKAGFRPPRSGQAGRACTLAPASVQGDGQPRSLLLKSLGYNPLREIASEAPFCDCSGPSGVVLQSFQCRFTVAEDFFNRLLGATESLRLSCSSIERFVSMKMRPGPHSPGARPQPTEAKLTPAQPAAHHSSSAVRIRQPAYPIGWEQKTLSSRSRSAS